MKNTIKIMVAILAVALITGMGTANTAEAKAKAYKTKTIKVTEGKSKTIKTKKKIKKIVVTKGKNDFGVGLVHKDGSVSDNPNAAKGKKKFTVWGTSYGRKYEVKVTYTNKYTQKFKIKTKATGMPSYAKKVVNELKPLLADPDKGLQTVLAQWEKKLGGTYEFKVQNHYKDNTSSEMTMDEVMKNYTTSQKKALILEVYFSSRMTYGLDGHKRTESYWYNRKSNAFFKLLYEGKFWGYCGEGATMAYDICEYLGIKAYYVQCDEINHGWTCIWVTDKNGTSYWHGIKTTAHAYNLKSSIPQKVKITKAQCLKYQCNPHATNVTKRRVASTKTPATTPAPTGPVLLIPTPAPTQTPAPQRILIPHTEHNYTCPGCNVSPYRHKDSTNPYITNFTKSSNGYTVYAHNYNGIIRYFDADGNEYIDINNDGSIIDELIQLAG